MLGMLVVGLLMDREVLLSYDLETEGRWQGFVVRYGLENAATRITLLIAPIAAILAIVTSLLGADGPDAPSVEPRPGRPIE